ncbi:hypothetical protein JDV02_000388 [Purpureocillium takamizusanense]|uniref:Transmembrane protein n=1 Tax=Purpureocillium takamizusanense TaxID=2060973 RepID=A0A9Q8Q713_9HYPO|nr:uncharacterized protein JDV02_000388 [Purpureocillium takamizusanense]UNI13666.1 hypothetical protein JDV02_000388 [Purpureocillium takamizusanense]
MRRALLSSSDVSVLASMAIVILCTLALFLSGYAIQQRTLRDLRAAIRPRETRPSPKAHLPDRFRTSTTELGDGTVVLLESDADKEAKEVERLVATAHAPSEAETTPREEEEDASSDHDGRREKQQQQEEGERRRASRREKGNKDDKAAAAARPVSQRQRAIIEQLQADVAAKSWGVEHPDPLKKSKVPITRAERRRLIKEEISRLAQSEQRVYYQRRLW